VDLCTPASRRSPCAGGAEATEHLQMDATRSTECTQPLLASSGLPLVGPHSPVPSAPRRVRGRCVHAGRTERRPSVDHADQGSLAGPSLLDRADDARFRRRPAVLPDRRGEGRIQSCTANADLLPLAARFDQDSRRLEVVRGDEVLCAGTVDSAGAVDTDMWGLRTIVADVVAGPQWSTFFSDLLGKRVRLVQARQSAYDVHPATILGSSSVAELARRSSLASVDPRRFRMLIEFSGGTPHLEDSWGGTLLRIGGAVLRGGGPVKRCAATTRDPASGAADLQTLRLITGPPRPSGIRARSRGDLRPVLRGARAGERRGR
jgi:hypothetical protein